MSDEDRTPTDSEPSRDTADLEERDRAQPNLVTEQANLRAGEDDEAEERARLVEEVEDQA